MWRACHAEAEASDQRLHRPVSQASAGPRCAPGLQALSRVDLWETRNGLINWPRRKIGGRGLERHAQAGNYRGRVAGLPGCGPRSWVNLLGIRGLAPPWCLCALVPLRVGELRGLMMSSIRQKKLFYGGVAAWTGCDLAGRASWATSAIRRVYWAISGAWHPRALGGVSAYWKIPRFELSILHLGPGPHS